MEINMPPLDNNEQFFVQRMADTSEITYDIPEKSRKICKKSLLIGSSM